MAKDNDNLIPAMRQFHHFKEKYPDAVLFFRMGDFYETFYEDAQICSRALGLTLTSRNKGTNPIPLAGVPYHAVDGYLKKMIQAGYKVAVCAQYPVSSSDMNQNSFSCFFMVGVDIPSNPIAAKAFGVVNHIIKKITRLFS